MQDAIIDDAKQREYNGLYYEYYEMENNKDNYDYSYDYMDGYDYAYSLYSSWKRQHQLNVLNRLQREMDQAMNKLNN